MARQYKAGTATDLEIGPDATNIQIGQASSVITIPSTTGASFTAMPKIPTATVAATGSDQAGAAAITTGFTLVTAADDTKGVRLPAAAAGLQCIVKNGVGNKILKVYPGTSDVINALSANASLDMAAATIAYLVAYDATTWYSTPLLPS